MLAHKEANDKINQLKLECQSILKSIEKADLIEMSKYSNPSPNFMPCIRIFCIMFGLEPDLKQVSKFDSNGVFAVVKRRFAKAKEFLMDLQSF